MILNPIITSLLENDLYKFSMGQAIYHQFASYKATWDFKCRNKDVFFTKEMVKEIQEQVNAYCNLRFTEEELSYLDSIEWLKGSYIDFLRLWHPRSEDILITTDSPCGLSVEARGTWLNTSMYEIPILAIVNETYFRLQDLAPFELLKDSYKKKLKEKVEGLVEGKYHLEKFSEFGLRRRLSSETQDYLIGYLKENQDSFLKNGYFVGTSNVYLAKKHEVLPVGTMAHEWIMNVGQGNHKHNPAYSNWYALDAWIKEYGVKNGIALTDTITTDCFLKDFQLTYATLFSGVRHDSGDPIAWGRKLLEHYKKLNIDSMTKTLLFSDSLDFEKATEIYKEFAEETNVAFGIGTYLSNDTSIKPLNIVMKPVLCNGQDVAKLSDSSGKGMCRNPEYVSYLKRCIDWRMNHENKT